MPLRSFLVVSEIPRASPPVDVRVALQRLAVAAHAEGLHATETFVSMEKGRAFTTLEADTPERLHRVFAQAGLRVTEILPGESVATDLLDEPRRAR